MVGGQRSVVEELVVLDSAGRLQLPGDQRMLAGIRRRAKVELVDGGILIRPSDDDRDEAAPSAPEAASGAALYRSLYSNEPPLAAPETNAASKNGKRSWWPARRKRA